VTLGLGVLGFSWHRHVTGLPVLPSRGMHYLCECSGSDQTALPLTETKGVLLWECVCDT
jgi:hypothetical protein